MRIHFTMIIDFAFFLKIFLSNEHRFQQENNLYHNLKTV